MTQADMATATPVLPNPVFEGSEKRVEIDFDWTHDSPANGLRALSRQQLDELMSLAACTIVSSRTNTELDAYVLSESSLFVYPTKWVLKTCGTTKLLNAVPRLLQLAAAIGMTPRRCKYSRASFLFPEQQPFPHTSFEHEAFFLRKHFASLGNGGSAYVLGDMFNGLQWHVYVVDAEGARYSDELHPLAKPTHKLEVCMTGLAVEAAAPFFRDPTKTAAQVTTETGIRRLVPAADIDDYVFEPCGYSMNGILGGGFMTIHITPEQGFSYASVEVSGFDPDAYDPADMVSRILAIFRPDMASVSLSVDAAPPSGEYAWGTLAARPTGYGCASATCQELATGGRVSYYTFSPVAATAAVASAAAAAAAVAPAAADVDGPPRPKSPAGVLLRHMPSFNSLPSLDNSELDSVASSGGLSLSEGGEEGGEHAAVRLAAALRALRSGAGRSRRGSGSVSPKSVKIIAPYDTVPVAPGACAPDGVAAAVVVACAEGGSPASPTSPVRLTA